jgi:uncharacterized protein YndB with AHSA1/START domain
VAIVANVADVRRQLHVAPEIVFSAFADPQLVSRWLKPSPDVRLDVLVFDFQVGGPTASPTMCRTVRSCTSMASSERSTRRHD